MHVIGQTYNPVAENTYILYDDSGECVIVDPGCYFPEEKEHFRNLIEERNLTPVRLLNTHCHFDHVFGNKYVCDTWNLAPEFHREEERILTSVFNRGREFGFELEPSPPARAYIQPGTTLSFGQTTLEVLFTPGHSPGSVCFYHRASQQVISGDVIFEGSIGRTDLPGGSLEVLMESIYQQLLPLGDDLQIYPGHGPSTTVGKEKKFNPFLR